MITSPTDITGCVLWLDASDTNTVIPAEVTAEEQAILSSWGIDYSSELKSVSQWVDKANPSSPIVLSLEGSMQPRLSPAALNGLNALKFDGNDYVDLPDGLVNYESMTMFIVGQCYKIEAYDQIILTNWSSNVSKDLLRLAIRTADFGKAFVLEAGRYGGDDWINSGVPAQENQTFMYSLSTLKGFLEGKINTQSAGVARVFTAGPINDLRIGAGKGGMLTHGIKGYVGEMILFNKALSASEMQEMELYLVSKWGIGQES